jgi:hypothetical protein
MVVMIIAYSLKISLIDGALNWSDLMTEKKRVLGRGLEDLLAQHDQDLPFLDSYGPDVGVGEGLPAGAGEHATEDLLEAIFRLLRAEGQTVSSDDGIVIEGLLKATPAELGVHLSFQSGDTPLPLVPSDLGAPGLEDGQLASDRSEATVSIVQWGIPSRRLLERLCEHWSS